MFVSLALLTQPVFALCFAKILAVYEVVPRGALQRSLVIAQMKLSAAMVVVQRLGT